MWGSGGAVYLTLYSQLYKMVSVVQATRAYALQIQMNNRFIYNEYRSKIPLTLKLLKCLI